LPKSKISDLHDNYVISFFVNLHVQGLS
jgi:hypothetical protein